MYCFDKNLAHSEATIVCDDKGGVISQYSLEQLTNICIPNRSLAWSITEGSELEKKLYKAVDEYNQYIDWIISIPNFLNVFSENNCCLRKEKAIDAFGTEIAEKMFSLPKYVFETDLRICGDCLFDDRIPNNYSAHIGSEDILIPVGRNGYNYPKIIDGRTAVWNWVDNGHDFCYGIWDLLGGRYCKSNSDIEEDDALIYQFDAYDQFRHEATEPQLVKIFIKLEKLGYINTYTLRPSQDDPRWSFYGKKDGTIDVALVDMSFKNNHLLMEQIELILWSFPSDLKEKPYILTNEQGKQYLSSTPGSVGGHKPQKIYGTLECPSAKRYLAKGQYARNRVFFDSEETAIKAGYRPCGVCMKEKYTAWKQKRDGK